MDQNSSYYKVYVALSQTETWRNTEVRVEEVLAGTKVESVAFKCVITSDDKARVYPVFKILYGPPSNKSFDWEYRAVNDSENWNINPHHLWNSTDATAILNNHFGSEKDVKTRNCKLQTIIDGSYRKDIKSFSNWMFTRFENKFSDTVRNTRDRLKADCLKILATETYAQSLKDAEVKFCKDSITGSMMQWRHMPDEILREAWNQFITTSVMEE